MSWKFFTAAGAEKRAPSTVVNPMAKLSATSAQTIGAAAFTTVTFATTDYSTQTGLVSGNSFVIQSAGKYLIHAAVAAASTEIYVQVMVNGVVFPDSQSFSGRTPTANGGQSERTTFANLNAGDIITVQVWTNPGVNINSRTFEITKVDGAVVSYVGVPSSLVGQTLSYAQKTTSVTTTAANFAAATDMLTSPSVTFDGTTSVDITTYFPSWYNNTINAINYVGLGMDGTWLCYIASNTNPAANSNYSGQTSVVRVTPTAGTHVFNVRLWTTAGTASIAAGVGTGGDWAPAFIRIVRAA